MNGCRFEWINAMKQIVLCTQILHDVLRPGFTARLEGQTKAVSADATKKSNEIFARGQKGLRALEEDDARIDGLRHVYSA